MSNMIPPCECGIEPDSLDVVEAQVSGSWDCPACGKVEVTDDSA